MRPPELSLHLRNVLVHQVLARHVERVREMVHLQVKFSGTFWYGNSAGYTYGLMMVLDQ